MSFNRNYDNLKYDEKWSKLRNTLLMKIIEEFVKRPYFIVESSLLESDDSCYSC